MALDKQTRIDELTTSGSQAIKSIDPYGRHNFFAEQMKKKNGSMDGEMSGRLHRKKYDEEQLLLAVDTVVDELIGDKPKDLAAVVLQEDYDSLLAQLNACLEREKELQSIIDNLRAKVSDLESQIEGLKAELDSAELRVAVAENSAEALADKYSNTVTDLQQAIAKSVAEAIERVSLEAQVEGLTAQKEALVKQVSTLEEQVAGKTAQLAAGAEAGGDKFTVNCTPKSSDSTSAELYYYSTRRGTRNTGWKNGPNIELLNTFTEPITVTFTRDGDKWLVPPPDVTLQPGENKIVKCGPAGKKALNGRGRKKNDYKGTLRVKAAGAEVSLYYKNTHHRG
tara:strand:+ start:5432 stop:6445 length:1014 start_codon:yes stop_codon:yes gene_type:complete